MELRVRGLPGRPDRRPSSSGTQASIAVSADGEHWFLINASPDLRQQLNATPQLHPKAGALRHSPIAGVILTNGEIDAVTGLLSMREGSPFTIYAHEKVLAILTSNSIFNVLNEKNVTAPADRDRRAVRAATARRHALGPGGAALRGVRQVGLVPGRQGASRRRDRRSATRWA